jgi:hypothetical protein
MIKKILNAIWDFLIDISEYRERVYKMQGYKAWY